jgi:hypothetical protein
MEEDENGAEDNIGDVDTDEEEEFSSMFNMGGDTSLSTSSPSPSSLRPCILAIRGWLRPRELPLWS